jgi:hypothetical protein
MFGTAGRRKTPIVWINQTASPHLSTPCPILTENCAQFGAEFGSVAVSIRRSMRRRSSVLAKKDFCRATLAGAMAGIGAAITWYRAAIKDRAAIGPKTGRRP